MCANYVNGEVNGKAAYGQPVGAPVGVPSQWTTGLCGCCEDSSNCCVTWCCPCITFGRNAEIIDNGVTSCAHGGIIYFLLACVGCACYYTCTYRTKLRAFFNLPEDPCNDCLVHCCCLPCALCQEHRELMNRGVDPTQGWMVNAQKWKEVTMVPPAVAPAMGR
ncbi:protein PLANT CADMIUM RESISTANCE 7-like [Ipomoea triloba]|uniref:protein PLANT CADMIUM RESISTANCE 7-like n=1 Tax=Ipomoea triloba TaxID=35885 RepID=UPI00125D7C53|nr:protein PLANT CADMIUM RESISTANCE 7-like [Ipomoea triloba]GMC55407.1 cell number regulator 2-like [Ipomoea batatas]GMC89334.1 cell number regulator 2-like [Ipomoea batatas]